MTFKYTEAKSFWEERLESITYHNATGSGSEVVAKYAYGGSEGFLTEAWDPRISPNLKEKYTYVSGKYLLAGLTPPGQKPWEFKYYNEGVSGTSTTRPLKSVSRASLLASPSVAQATIVYDVPISGSGAPYDLSPASVAEWGQTDYPVNATAIFPPSEVPAEPPSDYTEATVSYMDPDGYLVNTVSHKSPRRERTHALHRRNRQTRKRRSLALASKSTARPHRGQRIDCPFSSARQPVDLFG